MKIQTRQITTEHLLYLLAFGMALGLRLVSLGDSPLSDFEAGHAIQSWYALHGEPLDIGTNPGYFGLTTMAFYLFPPSDALARFWPALVGSLLVLAPFGFRRLFGRKTALIIAYGFALDPGLVTLSRIAGGPMMAVGFGILALAFFINRKPVYAGFSGGLALASGPAGISGLVSFLIAYFLVRLAGLTPVFNIGFESDPGKDLSDSSRSNTRLVLIIGSGTILLVSTLFASYPAGLGSLGGALENYFRGWTTLSDTPVLRPVLAVIIYQPVVFIFALIAAIRGRMRGEKNITLLSFWVLVVLLLCVIYPGRQVQDVVWVLPLLWALAAIELTRYIKMPQHPTTALSLAGAVFVLSVLFWLMSFNQVPGSLTWVILVVVPLLITMTTILVGLGWSWDSAQSGSIWGVWATAGVYTIAMMFGAAHIRSNSPEELWAPPPQTVQARLLVETLDDLAVIHNSREDRIEIVSTMDSPALRWTLKNYPEVRYVSNLDPKLLPSVIITSENTTDGSDLSQTMAYRGQDFVWSAYPGWSGALPPEWWKWITTRQAPILNESLVLWARSDYFPEQSNGETDPVTLVPADNEIELLQEGSAE